jgi:hypothetical protein
MVTNCWPQTRREFALACYRLYSDASIWHRLRTNALNRVRQDCDPAAFSLRVASVLRSLRFECPPSKHGAASE